MSISISNESKIGLTVTNESKPSGGTWSSTPGRTWADGGTWGTPGVAIVRDSKNSISVSNDSKN